MVGVATIVVDCDNCEHCDNCDHIKVPCTYVCFRLVSLVPAILGQFETMFGNTTEWMMMEHIVNVIDVFVVNMRDRFDDIAGRDIFPANKASVHV